MWRSPAGAQAPFMDASGRTRSGRAARLFLFTLLSLVAGAFLFARAQPAAADTPTPTPSTVVRVDPPTQTVASGTDVVVDIRVDNVTDLGAYEFELAFDPIMLSYVSVTNGPFLGSTGRSVTCLPSQLGAGTVRFGCVTLGAGAGPTGSGLLATLHLATSCSGTSSLHLNLAGLSNTLGTDIATVMQDGDATVTGTGACPTATPSATPGAPTHTPTRTSTRTPTITPTATPASLLCQGGGTSLCIVPVSQVAPSGSLFSVQVALDNVSDFGAFQFDLTFDSALVTAVAVSNAPFLGSTGRSVVCIDSLGVGRVELACSTLGTDPPGPTGSGMIADVTLFAKVSVTGTSPLTLADVIVTDTAASPITLGGIQGASVDVVPPPPATETPTRTPTPTRTITPTITPGGPTTIVRVDPADQTVLQGSNVVVNIAIDNVVDLGAFEFELHYDPTRLSFVQAAAGPFLASNGGTVACIGVQVDSVGGRVQLGCVVISGPTPSGSGVLATLTFGTFCGGISDLGLSVLRLADSTGAPIPRGVLDGSATIDGTGGCPTAQPTSTPTHSPTATRTSTRTATPGPPPDATVRVLPSGQTVPAGNNVVIDVTVDNVTDLGAYEFELAYDSSFLGFVQVTNGAFLGSGGGSVFCIGPNLDAAAGRLHFGCVAAGAPSGVNGSGILATVTLGSFCAGSGPLGLPDVRIADSQGILIPRAIEDASASATGGGACPTPTLTGTPTRTFTPFPTGPTATPTATPASTGTPEPARCAPAPATVVCVSPVNQTVFTGNATTVEIAVDAAPELGAFQFTLLYDPAVAFPISLDAVPMLGSTGRAVNCLQPAQPAGVLQLSCVTLGPTPPGAAGNGVLARITMRGVDQGGTGLVLQDVILTNVAGAAYPAPTRQDGSLTVVDQETRTPTHTPTVTQTPTETPTATPCPGVCPTATATATASDTNTPTETRTPTETGTPTRTPTAAPTVGPLTMRIAPASQSIPVVAAAAVDIVVDDVSNLGAFQFTLTYNPGFLIYQSIATGPFLGSTGRSVICLPPELTSNHVSYSCNTLGSTPAGPSGSGVLATVTFVGGAPGISPLDLSGIVLSSISGTSLAPVALQNGSITVTLPLTATPVNTPSGGSAGVPVAVSAIHGEPLVLAYRDSPDGRAAVPAVADPAQAMLFMDPDRANLFIGSGELRITEWVANVTDPDGLGAFQLQIAYDPNRVTVALAVGPFLGSLGRTLQCFRASDEGTLRFSCATLGSAAAPTGSGALATIIVRPAAGLKLRASENNGEESLLDEIFGQTLLSDPLGNDIPLYSAGDAHVFVRALAGDVSGDCLVNVLDQQTVAGRFGAAQGSLQYSALLDLEPDGRPDGDIDIKDIQSIYGRTGSTCESPHAGQELPPNANSTATRTRTATQTATPTATPTSTIGPEELHTVTPTGTAKATTTGTQSPPAPVTPSATSTATQTLEPGAPTSTVSPTDEASVTPTSTGSLTPTITASLTPTSTGSLTPTSTGSLTPTSTGSLTPTNTGSPTATRTITRTPTVTLTSTPLPPGVPTPTPTATSTPLIAGGLPATATPPRTATPRATSTEPPYVPPIDGSTSTATVERDAASTPTPAAAGDEDEPAATLVSDSRPDVRGLPDTGVAGGASQAWFFRMLGIATFTAGIVLLIWSAAVWARQRAS